MIETPSMVRADSLHVEAVLRQLHQLPLTQRGSISALQKGLCTTENGLVRVEMKAGEANVCFQSIPESSDDVL